MKIKATINNAKVFIELQKEFGSFSNYIWFFSNYTFFPFMYGIYPYTMATDKQKQAMKIVGYPYNYMTIYEITYKALKKILK